MGSRKLGSPRKPWNTENPARFRCSCGQAVDRPQWTSTLRAELPFESGGRRRRPGRRRAIFGMRQRWGPAEDEGRRGQLDNRDEGRKVARFVATRSHRGSVAAVWGNRRRESFGSRRALAVVEA